MIAMNDRVAPVSASQVPSRFACESDTPGGTEAENLSGPGIRGSQIHLLSHVTPGMIDHWNNLVIV